MVQVYRLTYSYRLYESREDCKSDGCKWKRNVAYDFPRSFPERDPIPVGSFGWDRSLTIF